MKELFFKFRKWTDDKKNLNIKKTFFGYPLYKENDNYVVFRHPIKSKKVVAGYDRTAVIQNGLKLVIYPNVANKFHKYSVKLNNRFFPGLISDSRIDRVLVLPYLREIELDKFSNSVRVVVITDRGQIFHNYPSKNSNYDGKQSESDVCVFEESFIWDLPSAKYPSNSPECEECERFFPGLPQNCYEYHPPISSISKKSFVFYDKGEKIELPRFYIHSRNPNSNPFHFIGSGELNHKMTLIGTYRTNTNTGVRTCIFASDDGGKNWFCKFEFADSGEYLFRQGDSNKWGLNFGNHIKNLDYDKNYTPDSIDVYLRSMLFDDTSSCFSWFKVGSIKAFEKNDNIVIRFTKKHHLSNGNVVALNSNEIKDNRLYSWMLNYSFSDCSNGTGVLFKIIVVDDYRVELAEFVCQSEHNIPCRHIHHINQAKDGWLIGTGEIYPNGWLLYFQMKEADSFSIKRAYSHFDIFRLNSKKSSVQRTMGAILGNEDDPLIMYASDHDTLEAPYIHSLKNNIGFEISRNSTGIFIGKLSDINDRSKFKCLFGAKEPCFFFQKISGKLVFCGQRGELLISCDNGSSWLEDRIDDCFYYYYGSVYDFHIFDNYVIRFKK